MYYLIDLNATLYDIVAKNEDFNQLLPQLGPSKIIASTNFLETFFSLVRKNDLVLYYYDWTTADALSGKRYVQDLRTQYHFLLFYNKWSVCGKLVQVTEQYFKFIMFDGTEVITKQFKQGDVFDN
jgi:hypothetical protein